MRVMAKKSGNKLLPAVVVVVILLVVGFLAKDKLMPQAPAMPEKAAVMNASEKGLSAELLNLDNNYAPSEGLPYGSRSHVVVASNGTPDVRTLLPLALRLDVDGATVWEGKIEGDPSVVCRGANGCSVDGPQVDPTWEGKLAELFVTLKGQTYLLWSSAK